MSKSFPQSLRKYDAYVATRFEAAVEQVLLIGSARLVVRERFPREEWERQRAHPCNPSQRSPMDKRLVGFGDADSGRPLPIVEVVDEMEAPEELRFYGADVV